MIVRNFLFLSGGEVIGRFFSFLAILYLTRKISLINFGLINFALTYINYFSLLTNLGLLLYGIRKVASGLNIKETVNKIFSSRLLLGILATFLSILLINILKKDFLLRKMVLFYSFFILTDAINLEWFFLGKGDTKFCVLNRFLINFFYFLLLIIFLKNEKEILFIPFAFILGNLTGSLMLLYFYYKKFHEKIRLQLDLKEKFFLLKETLPLGAAQILIQLYTLSGIFLLGVFNMKKELGYFSAGFRVLLVLMIFDRVFNQVILPFLTKKFQEGNFAIIENIVRLVLIFLLPIAFFLLMVSDKLFLVLFPKEYLPGEKIFQILVGFFVITVLNSVFSLSLIALKKDEKYFRNILIGTVFNFLTAIPLIKIFFHFGASLALLATEFLILLLNFRTWQNFYKIDFLICLPLPFLFTFSILPIFLFKNFSLWLSFILFLIIYFVLFLIFKKRIKKDYYLLK